VRREHARDRVEAAPPPPPLAPWPPPPSLAAVCPSSPSRSCCPSPSSFSSSGGESSRVARGALRRRRLRGEGPEPERGALSELRSEPADGGELARARARARARSAPPRASAAAPAAPGPLRLGLLEPPRGLGDLPGREVDPEHVGEARVHPLPDVAAAAAGEVEQRGAGAAREGAYELSLDAVVVLLEGEGGSLRAGAQGLFVPRCGALVGCGREGEARGGG